jgi:hypothetical protein
MLIASPDGGISESERQRSAEHQHRPSKNLVPGGVLACVDLWVGESRFPNQRSQF